MEGYKKIEALIKLKKLKKTGIPVLLFLFIVNTLCWFLLEPSVFFEIGMLVSIIGFCYLIFDDKGY